MVKPGGCVLVFEFRRAGLGRFLVSAERLLGEPGAFMEPDELRAHLAARGIEGNITDRGFVAYSFVGRTAAGG